MKGLFGFCGLILCIWDNSDVIKLLIVIIFVGFGGFWIFFYFYWMCDKGNVMMDYMGCIIGFVIGKFEIVMSDGNLFDDFLDNFGRWKCWWCYFFVDIMVGICGNLFIIFMICLFVYVLFFFKGFLFWEYELVVV